MPEANCGSHRRRDAWRQGGQPPRRTDPWDDLTVPDGFDLKLVTPEVRRRDAPAGRPAAAAEIVEPTVIWRRTDTAER